MSRIFQSTKHYVLVDLVNPIRILQNCKIVELEKITIRNPNEYLFKEQGGKLFIVIKDAGEFEVKGTLEEIAKELQDFGKDFNKDFDEFIQNTTPESRHLMGY